MKNRLLGVLVGVLASVGFVITCGYGEAMAQTARGGGSLDLTLRAVSAQTLVPAWLFTLAQAAIALVLAILVLKLAIRLGSRSVLVATAVGIIALICAGLAISGNSAGSRHQLDWAGTVLVYASDSALLMFIAAAAVVLASTRRLSVARSVSANRRASAL